MLEEAAEWELRQLDYSTSTGIRARDWEARQAWHDDSIASPNYMENRGVDRSWTRKSLAKCQCAVCIGPATAHDEVDEDYATKWVDRLTVGTLLDQDRATLALHASAMLSSTCSSAVVRRIHASYDRCG